MSNYFRWINFINITGDLKMVTSIGAISISNSQPDALMKNITKVEGDNIFACCARKAGMEGFANFLRDDWVEKSARKAGFNNLANWLEKDENDKAFTKLVKSAVKHPVITIAAIATAVFAGKKISDYIKTSNTSPVSAETVQITETAETVKSAASVVEEAVPVKSVSEQIEELNKALSDGIGYEKKIGFKNLEIFKDVPEAERQSIVAYYETVHKEKDLLMFASGNKPAVLENFEPHTFDLFDSLRSDRIDVAEFAFTKGGNLVLNKEAAQKVIAENKDFFIKRLGLPEGTTVKDIYKKISGSHANLLSNPNKFEDLKQLLFGATKENALHAQMVQDARAVFKFNYYEYGNRDFHSRTCKSIESYKETLKEALMRKDVSYNCMDSTFKEKLIKLIDSITSSEYSRRFNNLSEFFQHSDYQERELKALKDLVRKIELSRETGALIGFN